MATRARARLKPRPSEPTETLNQRNLVIRFVFRQPTPRELHYQISGPNGSERQFRHREETINKNSAAATYESTEEKPPERRDRYRFHAPA